MIWEGPAAVAVPLAFFVGLGLTSWAWGEALLRAAAAATAATAGDDGPGQGRVVGRWALASTLGLGAGSQCVFVLGLLDRLDGPHLAALFVGGHLLAASLRVWRHLAAVLRAAAPFAAASLPTVALALYPPAGFDATVYHLPYATRFLELGGLAFLPELRFPVFPQLAEMAFVPALLVAGDVGAQLCQALCLLLGGGVVYRWARDRSGTAGDKGVIHVAGFLSAALWFGLPLAVWIGAQAYVDVELALFVAAGAACLDRGRPGLAGVLFGFAAATKYLGLFFCVAAAVLVLTRPRPGVPRETSRARDLGRLTLGGLFVAGPWTLRLVVLTGNPVFPFYPRIFGDSAWSQGHRVELADGSWPLVDLITLPWDAVFDRARFHYEAPLSPWYLVLLPVLLVLGVGWWRRARVPNRDLGLDWLGVFLVFALFWLTTQGEIRFWLPALPLLHLPLSLVLARLLRTDPLARRPWLPWTVAALLLAPGWLYGVYKLADLGPLPLDPASRRAHLAERVPGYAAIDFLNHLGAHDAQAIPDADPGAGHEVDAEATVYGLHGERLRHYAIGPRATRPYLGDFFGPDRYALVETLLATSADPPAALRSFLRERSVGFLLMPSQHRSVPALRDAPAFETIYEDRDFVVFEIHDA